MPSNQIARPPVAIPPDAGALRRARQWLEAILASGEHAANKNKQAVETETK
jgi:hypothetical protein